MYYAQKQFVVTAKKAEEDGWISTLNGDMRVKSGEIILTDYNGNPFLTDEDFFKEDYVPIKLINKKIDIEAMARGYEEMYKLNQDEDEDYILGMKKTLKHR